MMWHQFNALLANSSVACIALAGVLGLLVGSFLNVVIYRLPVMMQREWRKECQDYLGVAGDAEDTPFNLMVPLSRCPSCETPIKPYQNMPVISYLLLRGQCASCGCRISIRYPLIEALTAVLSMVVAVKFGYNGAMMAALLLTWTLVVLSFIDIDHYLLPDAITLPMLWLGLLFNVFGVFTDGNTAIIGAASGYLLLWSVYHLFKLVTGKEGMGYGDFKLLALFGAWLGWEMLPLIVLLSSLVGTGISIAAMIIFKADHRKPVPFGPYLAIAGWIALLWGQEINRWYLSTL